MTEFCRGLFRLFVSEAKRTRFCRTGDTNTGTVTVVVVVTGDLHMVERRMRCFSVAVLQHFPKSDVVMVDVLHYRPCTLYIMTKFGLIQYRSGYCTTLANRLVYSSFSADSMRSNYSSFFFHSWWLTQ